LRNIYELLKRTIFDPAFVKRHLVREMLFWISMVLSIVSSIFMGARLGSIDWEVIAKLFSLMLVVQAFKEYGVLEWMARSSLKSLKSPRSIGVMIVLLTASVSSLITNDVALITLVPLTMLIALKAGFEPMWLVMIQSQAADVGSALTPIGNPQNLFLFEKYQVPVGEFVSFLLPFTVFGVCWTLVMNLLNSRKKASFTVEPSKIREPRKLMIFALAFLVVMLSVFRVIDYRIGLILTFVVTMVLDMGFFKKIDYFLLGTFAFFFIFIDNMARTEFISGLMRSVANGDMETMVNSALFSQIISNVPSAILFSSFTDSYKGLTLGVNIGGSGTIIASLANLIAYRIYVKERGQNGKYLIIFMVSSTVSLLLSLTFGFFRLKLLGL